MIDAQCKSTIGPDCTIADTARIGYLERGGRIEIGCGVRIRDGAVLWTCGGRIVVGDRTVIGLNCVLCGYGGLTIGNDCMISPHAQIYAQNHGTARGASMAHQPSTGKGVTIGDDVWVGAGAVVLDGVTVHRGAVIGAGAIVTHDVPEYEMWAGNPARKIGERT